MCDRHRFPDVAEHGCPDAHGTVVEVVGFNPGSPGHGGGIETAIEIDAGTGIQTAYAVDDVADAVGRRLEKVDTGAGVDVGVEDVGQGVADDPAPVEFRVRRQGSGCGTQNPDAVTPDGGQVALPDLDRAMGGIDSGLHVGNAIVVPVAVHGES